MVIALSCSCCTSNIRNSITNDVTAGTNMSKNDTKTPDKNGDMLLHVVIMGGEDIDVGLQMGRRITKNDANNVW